MSEQAIGTGETDPQERRRIVWTANGAHALHDGFTDLLFVLLPVWQAEFGLVYTQVGLLRSLYAGAMAGFQIPSGFLAERIGGRLMLALGTAVAAAGFLLAAVSSNILLLGAALLLVGLGASVQHPIGSHLIASAYPHGGARTALGTYNFAGDIGKMAVPASVAALLGIMSWRGAVDLMGALGLASAALIYILLPQNAGRDAGKPAEEKREATAPAPTGKRSGFTTLLSIGIIDSATRMGFLTFLPFLLKAKGATLPMLGLSLSLVFAGGAFGKLVCGFLGARFGVIRTVFLTEGLTALGIIALLPLPIEAALALLPLIGVALNGTSSVLYGTVPELVTPEKRQHAFSVFYTGTIGAGALSPILYGRFSDLMGIDTMMQVVAAIVLLTLPLAWMLRPALGQIRAQ